MTPDTCIQAVIPAEEVRMNQHRKVWIVKDTDGDWFKSYQKEYESLIPKTSIFYNPKVK